MTPMLAGIGFYIAIAVAGYTALCAPRITEGKMTDHPYKTLNLKAEEALDAIMNAEPDLSDADAAKKIAGLRTLAITLESGLKIAGNFMRTGKEPYPGAALDVVNTSQRCIDLARKSRLLP